MVNTAASWLTGAAASFVQGSVLQLIGIVLTFYILFYFLRDRSAVLESLRSLSPLSGAEMNRVFDGVADTVHATLYGTLAVAVVQGTLGGLMFWWLGLPVLGAFVIWIPAAIFLVLEGSGGESPAAHPLGRGRGRRNRQLAVSDVGWKAIENAHYPRVYFYRRWADCFWCIRPDPWPSDTHSHQTTTGNLEWSECDP